jgi:hypothetical protein
MTELQATHLNRTWLLKMIVFLVLLVGFGSWGLYDAVVVYPRNGEADASFKLKSLLEVAAKEGRLTPAELRVEDPRRALADLSARAERERRNRGAAAPADKLSDFDKARFEFLQALDRVWRLQAPEIPAYRVRRTLIGPTGQEVIGGIGAATQARQQEVQVVFQPRDAAAFSIARGGQRTPETLDTVLRELTEHWKTAKAPKPLAFYDLPSQWLFVAIGYGGGLYLAGLIGWTGSRKYRYDKSEHCLVLPGGAQIRPADVAEFDKRRWHKYFLTLRLRDGRAIRLDLLRHVPLEDWVLSMERIAFPEAAAEAEAGPAPGGEGALGAPAVGSAPEMPYGGVHGGIYAVLLFDPTQADAGDAFPRQAQEDAIRSLALALEPEGGWHAWLTACAGRLASRPAMPGTSSPIDTFAHWLADGDPAHQIDTSRLDASFAIAARNRSLSVEPYAIVIGRLTESAAARLHDKMSDPPAAGYLGVAIARVNPSQIERFSEPLALETGLEIKGAHCRGPWLITDEVLAEVGLSRETAAHSG